VVSPAAGHRSDCGRVGEQRGAHLRVAFALCPLRGVPVKGVYLGEQAGDGGVVVGRRVGECDHAGISFMPVVSSSRSRNWRRPLMIIARR
jgi:hypothetical protein